MMEVGGGVLGIIIGILSVLLMLFAISLPVISAIIVIIIVVKKKKQAEKAPESVQEASVEEADNIK